jgi:membrane fusion protein, multidrug efflux system
MLTRGKITILAVVVVGLGIAAYFGLAANQRNPAPKPASGALMVEAERVRQTRLDEVLTAVGTLRAAESVVLRSELSGRISKILFTDGATVKAASPLVLFDSAIQQAQVNQARAERELAAAKLRRTQELFEKQFLSAAALDDAKASEEIAQARLALAQATLDKMSLKAPFDGVIGIRQISVGDYVKEGEALVNLEDLSSMKVDFRVPERTLGRLAPGQQVMLQTDAYPGQAFPARVAAIDVSVDASGRSLLIRAELKDSSKRLKPGMFMRVGLVLESREAALIVPEEALVTTQGKLSVFRVIEGKASSVPVATGLRTQYQGRAVVEVLQGLSVDDLVITAGQIKVRGENVPVRVLSKPSKG